MVMVPLSTTSQFLQGRRVATAQNASLPVDGLKKRNDGTRWPWLVKARCVEVYPAFFLKDLVSDCGGCRNDMPATRPEINMATPKMGNAWWILKSFVCAFGSNEVHEPLRQGLAYVSINIQNADIHLNHTTWWRLHRFDVFDGVLRPCCTACQRIFLQRHLEQQCSNASLSYETGGMWI